MGTRSLINFLCSGSSSWAPGKKPLVTIYRQYDGYPEGRGVELAQFLSSIRLGNGISGAPEIGEYANGFGDLAAQWLSREKTCVGNVYLEPPGSSDFGEEYVYDVLFKNGEIRMYVTDDENYGIFDGTPEQFLKQFDTVAA